MAFRKKFKERFYSIFSIDFFSITPSSKITFLKKNSFSTHLGIVASWIVIILTFVTFFNFGSNMINRENPNFSLSQAVTPDPENFKMLPQQFFFAFGLQNLNNGSKHFINESIYTVQVIQRIKIEGNITLKYLNASICDEELVPNINDVKSYFVRNSIENLYCIQNYSEIVPELKSTWDGAFYKNVLVNVLACRNHSNKTNCQSPEIIKTTLNSANFALYMTNLAVDSNNYENPITYYGKQIFTPIGSTTSTYIELSFAHLEFMTDDGYLFENVKEIKTLNFVGSRQILTFSDQIVVQLDFKLDKIKTTYKRKYDTIQEVAANIGGVIQALMLIMNFLIPPLANLDFQQKLANYLFYFDQKCLLDRKSYKLHKQTKKSIVSKPVYLKEKKRKNFQEIKIERSEQREKNIKITYWEFIFSCLARKKTKNKLDLINKGLDLVNKTLDISFIMNKIIELEKLKILMLNKSQLGLFQLIPKPIISLSKSKMPSLHKDFSDFLDNKFKEDLDSRLKEIKDQQPNTIDERLIEMVANVDEKKILKPHLRSKIYS